MLSALEKSCAEDILFLETIKTTDYICLFRIDSFYDCYLLESLIKYFQSMDERKKNVLPKTQVEITTADRNRILELSKINKNSVPVVYNFIGIDLSDSSDDEGS